MKSPSIRDIAKALGVSIGTVDRALHGRSDVSPKTRARVLKKAEQLGYRPNYAARALKLNRKLRIGVYFPQQIASFFDPLRSGVRAAAAARLDVQVDLVFRSFPRLNECDLELIAADADQGFDGILVTPGNPSHLEPTLRALVRRGVAVICVASDAPHSGRLSCVSTDAYVSGAIAAELLSRAIHKAGPTATIIGELTTLDHAEKLRGFETNLAAYQSNLTSQPAIESHEKPGVAYRQALALLSRKPYPLGIYVSTANSIPVLRALEEVKLIGKVQVVTTDLFPALVPYIESGKILATLYQRPFSQGKLALDLMLRYLIEGKKPEAVARLAPHIILRSNLPLFRRFLGAGFDINISNE